MEEKKLYDLPKCKKISDDLVKLIIKKQKIYYNKQVIKYQETLLKYLVLFTFLLVGLRL